MTVTQSYACLRRNYTVYGGQPTTPVPTPVSDTFYMVSLQATIVTTEVVYSSPYPLISLLPDGKHIRSLAGVGRLASMAASNDSLRHCVGTSSDQISI